MPRVAKRVSDVLTKFWISCGNIESIHWTWTRLSIKNSVMQQRKNAEKKISNANVCATIVLRNKFKPVYKLELTVCWVTY